MLSARPRGPARRPRRLRPAHRRGDVLPVPVPLVHDRRRRPGAHPASDGSSGSSSWRFPCSSSASESLGCGSQSGQHHQLRRPRNVPQLRLGGSSSSLVLSASRRSRRTREHRARLGTPVADRPRRPDRAAAEATEDGAEGSLGHERDPASFWILSAANADFFRHPTAHRYQLIGPSCCPGRGGVWRGPALGRRRSASRWRLPSPPRSALGRPARRVGGLSRLRSGRARRAGVVELARDGFDPQLVLSSEVAGAAIYGNAGLDSRWPTPRVAGLPADELTGAPERARAAADRTFAAAHGLGFEPGAQPQPGDAFARPATEALPGSSTCPRAGSVASSPVAAGGRASPLRLEEFPVELGPCRPAPRGWRSPPTAPMSPGARAGRRGAGQRLSPVVAAAQVVLEEHVEDDEQVAAAHLLHRQLLEPDARPDQEFGTTAKLWPRTKAFSGSSTARLKWFESSG